MQESPTIIVVNADLREEMNRTEGVASPLLEEDNTGEIQDLMFFLFTEEVAELEQKELTAEGDPLTPSDVERALWSFVVANKALSLCCLDEKKTMFGRVVTLLAAFGVRE